MGGTGNPSPTQINSNLSAQGTVIRLLDFSWGHTLFLVAASEDQYRCNQINTTAAGNDTPGGHQLGAFRLTGYENIVKFLSESNSAIFDFENAEKRPCKIELSADIYSYYSEYDEKYSETKYYNHLNAYIMLTDEEMKKIIAYTEKGIVPDFDIEK